MSGPVIWIDATSPDHRRRVFGLTLLERVLRAVVEADVAPARVVVAQAAGAGRPELRRDLLAKLDPDFEPGAGPVGARLAAATREAGGRPLLALAADAVVDPRLVAHLARAPGSQAFLQRDGGAAAVLRLDPDAAAPDPEAASVREAAERGLARGDVKPFDEARFDGYVRKLRRELPPWLYAVPDDATAARVERELFWSNYKGSTDFMTRYVYPPLVWRLVRPLARWRVHPNWVTGVSWVATLAAIPLFASGQWVAGLALAYLMSVLDSVDGKLARLTYTSSKVGDVADHGLDIVHPPFWYLAWGWALGGGTAGSAPFQASLWMLGLYAADRIVTAIFRQMTGTSIHGVTPLDARMRTFISRRNVNLPVFTVALALGWLFGAGWIPVAAFHAIVGWQAASLAWHAQRLVAFWGTKIRED